MFLHKSGFADGMRRQSPSVSNNITFSLSFETSQDDQTPEKTPSSGEDAQEYEATMPERIALVPSSGQTSQFGAGFVGGYCTRREWFSTAGGQPSRRGGFDASYAFDGGAFSMRKLKGCGRKRVMRCKSLASISGSL